MNIAFDINEFEGAAAQVAGNAVGLVVTGDHAKSRETGFLLTGQDADPASKNGFRRIDEGSTVFRFPCRRGGEHVHFRSAGLVGERAEPSERGQSPLDAAFVHPAGGDEPLA